jgi:hypothetical protein
VALQELGYEIISVKQITVKRPSPKGGVTYKSICFFLVIPARSQKSQGTPKHISFCDITGKVETYISKNGLTQRYN